MKRVTLDEIDAVECRIKSAFLIHYLEPKLYQEHIFE